MTDTPLQSSQAANEPAREEARMSPIARLINVYFSPDVVFEDIRRSPGGWWLPILVGVMLFATMASIHVAKYDQGAITEEQMKASAFMKLAPADMQEKIIDQAVKAVRLTPAWHSQLQYFGWTPLGYTATILFFTFLYGLIAVMMGWAPDLRASTLFINLGLAVAICVVLAVISGIVGFLGGGGRGGEVHAPANWAPVVTTLCAWGATAGLFYLTSRTSRRIAYGRIFSTVSYASAPGAVAFLLGILIIFIRTPDLSPVQEIIPSSLGALLDPKTSSKWLISLASSLDLFSLWSIALTIIGLSKVLARKTSEAAMIVLVPWVVWVLLKVGFTAVTG